MCLIQFHFCNFGCINIFNLLELNPNFQQFLSIRIVVIRFGFLQFFFQFAKLGFRHNTPFFGLGNWGLRNNQNHLLGFKRGILRFKLFNLCFIMRLGFLRPFDFTFYRIQLGFRFKRSLTAGFNLRFFFVPIVTHFKLGFRLNQISLHFQHIGFCLFQVFFRFRHNRTAIRTMASF